MVLSLNSMSVATLATRIVAVLLAVLLLSGCAGTRGGPIDYNVDDFGRPDTPTTLTLEDDYKIGPMDTLAITVFQVPDLSGEFEVDLTGRIAMPLLGDVKAVDLTTAELDQRLTQQLGAKYLQTPDVSVRIKSSTRRNLTVDGSVRQPGMYPVTGPMTLIQAIALARGTDDSANPRRVAIFRQVEGKRMAAAFDLISIRRGQMDDPQVYSGDIIVVDGSKVRSIQREILTALPILGMFNPLY
jgi:polysaccharide biosynthesis/export protein